MREPSSTVTEDQRNIFGWCMYDWANSAYGTTVLAGLLGPYLALTFPDDVRVLGLSLSSEALFMLAAAVSAALIFLVAPVLGAVADFSASKKTFLVFFAYMGSLATLLLYFVGSVGLWFGIFTFIAAQTAFVAANVFYDSFLPVIATQESMDRISGRGYAFGYVGGGLQFLVALLLVRFYGQIGIEQDTAARIGMAMAGLWWAGFTLFTVKYLRERGGNHKFGEGNRGMRRALEFARIGISRTLETIRKVSRFRHLILFLVAFLFYNDGIQTAILVTTTYGSTDLMLDMTTLMVTLLVIQIVATGGALVFSRIAGFVGARRAVMVSLVGWSLLVVYAYTLRPGDRLSFFLMGGLAGLVLGGSQALSRSFFGTMIPKEASAEFYGFYSVFAKFSAIWGPLVLFGARTYFGDLRRAIPFLIAFFVIGLILLYFVDEEQARAASAEGAF